MTTNNEQEPRADQKQTATDVSTKDAEATNGAQELKSEELEERIAPTSLGGFTFTKPTSSSSP